MPSPNHRVRAALAVALLTVSLLAAGATVARAADRSAPGAVPATADPFELEGFRWNDRTQVDVYYNWDGGECQLNGSDLSGPASTLAPAIALETLEASLADINAQLRGGLTLRLVGQTTRADLCSTDSGRDIIVGWGNITSTGLTRLFGFTKPGDEFTTLETARVFVLNTYEFDCGGEPMYRDLQHLLTHELLHAIGVDHSADPTAIMAPVGTACEMAHLLQPDDVNALAALYTPTTPAATPTPTATLTPGSGFDRELTATGVNTALWNGGTLVDLDVATAAAQGVSITVFVDGGALVYIPGAPAFVNLTFVGTFPAGLPAGTIVLVVR